MQGLRTLLGDLFHDLGQLCIEFLGRLPVDRAQSGTNEWTTWTHVPLMTVATLSCGDTTNDVRALQQTHHLALGLASSVSHCDRCQHRNPSISGLVSAHNHDFATTCAEWHAPIGTRCSAWDSSPFFVPVIRILQPWVSLCPARVCDNVGICWTRSVCSHPHCCATRFTVCSKTDERGAHVQFSDVPCR